MAIILLALAWLAGLAGLLWVLDEVRRYLED